MKRYWMLSVSGITLILVALTLIFRATPVGLPETQTGTAQEAPTNTLPVVGSVQNLKLLLANTKGASGSAKALYGEAMPQAQAPSADSGHSATNLQVQGVDEADVVKTDGSYIYQVSGSSVIITRAYPADKMQVSANITLAENFAPREIYVDEHFLVVIGSRQSQGGGNSFSPGPETKIYPPPGHPSLVAQIYDINDKTAPKQVRQVEVDGDYLTSRKIGSSLYLVANRYLDVYRIMNDKETELPFYSDSSLNNGKAVSVELSAVRYFPGFSEPSYLVIAALKLDQPQRDPDVNVYLGAGKSIYASEKNLYVAVNSSETAKGQGELKPKGPSQAAPRIAVIGPAGNTLIFKFGLADGKTNFLAKGEVPGTVLNQFSMDEYQDYFRLATTKGWPGDGSSENNLYVLDSHLKAAGSLEDIAPGEQIHSARFMGDRAYLVTFKTVDPLFVLDLKNPRSPKILGALKIPGYSDYLHPFDENHIIGFGKDTVETSGGFNGKNPVALYQGLKLALFDVSDVAHPKEMFKEIIGDRGTDSELLRNHKALLFDKSRNLLAFPVTLAEYKPKQSRNAYQYGSFSFQGAYIYNIDLAKGFTLRGRITHLQPDDYLKAGDSWYQSKRNIARILYIGDNLYTVSDAVIKANSLNTLQEEKSVLLP